MEEGNRLYELNRFEEALVSFDMAIKFDLTNSDTFSNRKKCLKKLEPLDEAFYDKEKCLNNSKMNLKLTEKSSKEDSKTIEEELRSYGFDERANESYSKEYFNNYFLLEREDSKLIWIKSHLESR